MNLFPCFLVIQFIKTVNVKGKGEGFRYYRQSTYPAHHGPFHESYELALLDSLYCSPDSEAIVLKNQLAKLMNIWQIEQTRERRNLAQRFNDLNRRLGESLID